MTQVVEDFFAFWQDISQLRQLVFFGIRSRLVDKVCDVDSGICMVGHYLAISLYRRDRGITLLAGNIIVIRVLDIFVVNEPYKHPFFFPVNHGKFIFFVSVYQLCFGVSEIVIFFVEYILNAGEVCGIKSKGFFPGIIIFAKIVSGFIVKYRCV